MTSNEWRTLGAITAVCLVPLAIFGVVSLCRGKEPKPQPKPWVIYEEGTTTQVDRMALSTWIQKQARCGCGWSGADNQLDITLWSAEDATPRRELLKVAELARSKLPEGCPITIRVQTVDEAIQFEEGTIKRSRDDIERLKKIHGEQR